MNKASKALRRSSIRLKSFSSGHSELNLIVSDMKEVRSTAKEFNNAQETVWKDLYKWASREKNEAIRESFSYLAELNRLWTEVQTEFIDHLNKFKYAFEMILEGEMNVDKLRENLSTCELRETKLKKDLHKAVKKNSSAEIRQIEGKLVDNKSSMKSTQIEISERTHENEAVKVIRLKEGLLKLSEAYTDLAHKGSFIFDGSRSIAASLPEIGPGQCRGIHDVRYRGSEMAKRKVAQVKESVKRYKQVSQLSPGAPEPPLTQRECPPPYSTFYPPSYQNTIGFVVPPPNSWPPRLSSFNYRVPLSDDYEQDVAGAIGGVRM